MLANITNQRSARVAAKTLPTFRYRGLRNHGNDCYLHATLQMLLTASPFPPSLAGKASLDGEVGDLARRIVALSNEIKAPTTTQGFCPPAESTTVKHALVPFNDMFLTNDQQDAHECLTAILSGLEETVNEENEVFGFKVEICRECKSCPHAK